MISEEEISHVVRTYLVPESEWGRDRVARVLASLDPRPGEKILDLGAGNATFAFHCARRGAQTFALDRNPGVLARGRAAARAVGGPIPPRVAADAARVPFPSGAFDKVVSADFIEHIAADVYEEAAREAYRLLRPGGRYIVYTPNRWRVQFEVFGEHLKHALWCRHCSPGPWQSYVDPDHAWMKSPPEVLEPLRGAGFRTRLILFEPYIPIVSRFLGVPPARLPGIRRWSSNRILVVATK